MLAGQQDDNVSFFESFTISNSVISPLEQQNPLCGTASFLVSKLLTDQTFIVVSGAIIVQSSHIIDGHEQHVETSSQRVREH